MRSIQEKVKEFLSIYTEIHAFVIGIYFGLTEWKGTTELLMSYIDCKREPHYAFGGYILGTILRWIIVLSVGYKFFESMV